jgi:DNA helicase HerA-like ATPase
VSETATTPALDLAGTTAFDRLTMLRTMRESMFLPPIAYSIDGLTLQLESPLRDAPLVGSHVVVEHDDARLLAQVTSTAVEVREGPAMQFASSVLPGAESSMRIRLRTFRGTAVVLGSLCGHDFEALRDGAPFDETAFTPATDDDVRAYHRWARESSKRTTLDIGRAPSLPDARVHLHAAGLTRHTLFCGQSGSGKTFSLGVLLERVLVDTTLPLLVLDPNSDHVHLGALRSFDDANRTRALPLDAAGWSAVERAHGAVAGGVVVVQDPDMAAGHVVARDVRALVVDLGAAPDAAARHATSARLLQELWDSRRDREPILIVLDEAHDVCPAQPVGDDQRHATELAVAIAGEGRKFGRHLLLATQRPQKLHPNVVSQCDNLVLLRMNSSTDVDDIAGSFSHVPAGLLHRAPTFDQGMALVGGPLVPHPTLLRVDGRITPEGGSDVPISWA